jgi:hypothetical protein
MLKITSVLLLGTVLLSYSYPAEILLHLVIGEGHLNKKGKSKTLGDQVCEELRDELKNYVSFPHRFIAYYCDRR